MNKPIRIHPKDLALGTRTSRCAKCENVFTTVANFDRHRKDGKCQHPADTGLVVNSRGLWSMPGDDSLWQRDG